MNASIVHLPPVPATHESTIPGADFGVLLQPAGDPALTGLDAAALQATLVDAGAVLLRGFDWGLPELLAFTRAVVPRPIIYGGSRAQVSDDDRIQKAERGRMAVSLHCELAFTPFRPDLCLFACVRPADDDGETLIADGAAVLETLQPQTRARFTGRGRITYQRLFPASAWQRTFRTRSRPAVEAALRRFEQLRFGFSREDHLMCHFTTEAVVPGLDGRPAFANNVSNMVEAEGIIGSTVTWSGGEPLDRATRTELREVLRAAAVPIRWQAQDLLLVDNWRVLHGRNAFADPGRDLLTHFGNLREATLRPEHLLAGAD